MANESQNQNKSTILTLESLTKQYDTLLMQYNQVQSDYINYLQQNPSTLQQGSGATRNNQELTSIPNYTFWGTSGISSNNVSSVQQCSALCSRTQGCSGATYNVTNNNQNNCWLRSGDGIIVAGTSNQYAIISKSKEYLLTLQTLNSQLIDVNNKIIQLMQNNKNTFLAEIKNRKSKYILLVQNNSKLEEERNNILLQLSQFQSINEKQNEGELIVTKNYYTFVLLLIIALICMFILSKIYIGTASENADETVNILSTIFFIFIICVVVFIIYYYFHNRI
jgi:NADH:ubiquinone oxidoreductase subunit 3 (subunit A)